MFLKWKYNFGFQKRNFLFAFGLIRPLNSETETSSGLSATLTEYFLIICWPSGMNFLTEHEEITQLRVIRNNSLNKFCFKELGLCRHLFKWLWD